MGQTPLQTEQAFPANSEAEFLAAVGTVLQPQGKRAFGAERRRSNRYIYTATAMIGYCSEHQLPSIDQFQKYHCRDLSRGGFGFYSETEPDSNFLVASLRLTKQSLAIHSRVVHCTEIEFDHGSMFVIGCEFLKKIEFQAKAGSTAKNSFRKNKKTPRT